MQMRQRRGGDDREIHLNESDLFVLEGITKEW